VDESPSSRLRLGLERSHRIEMMLAGGAEVSFAKQPVIERSTGVIVGYAGVD
jgi:hypothetical protein